MQRQETEKLDPIEVFNKVAGRNGIRFEVSGLISNSTGLTSKHAATKEGLSVKRHIIESLSKMGINDTGGYISFGANNSRITISHNNNNGFVFSKETFDEITKDIGITWRVNKIRTIDKVRDAGQAVRIINNVSKFQFLKIKPSFDIKSRQVTIANVDDESDLTKIAGLTERDVASISGTFHGEIKRIGATAKIRPASSEISL